MDSKSDADIWAAKLSEKEDEWAEKWHAQMEKESKFKDETMQRRNGEKRVGKVSCPWIVVRLYFLLLGFI